MTSQSLGTQYPLPKCPEVSTFSGYFLSTLNLRYSGTHSQWPGSSTPIPKSRYLCSLLLWHLKVQVSRFSSQRVSRLFPHRVSRLLPWHFKVEVSRDPASRYPGSSTKECYFRGTWKLRYPGSPLTGENSNGLRVQFEPSRPSGSWTNLGLEYPMKIKLICVCFLTKPPICYFESVFSGLVV